MIATTRSATNEAYLRECGADHVIVDGRDDIADALARVTNGAGVNLAFDSVGGSMPSRYGPSLASDARIYLYGQLDPAPLSLPLFDMFRNNVVLHPYSVFHCVENTALRQRGLDFVQRAFARGNLRPHVDRVFAMEDYVNAWDYLTAPRSSHGKVVIETGL